MRSDKGVPDRAAVTLYSETPPIRYRITASYPHDPNAYTQGLLFSEGNLYEGTGVKGQSSIRRVELETGIVQIVQKLAPHLFGEGIASINGELYQLTWQSQTGFVYDKSTLKTLRSFTYSGEGWGLTFDGRHLILSDGSATLKFHDPKDFSFLRSIEVRGPEGPVTQLNELEYADGYIYANVWKTNRIVRISPESGNVVGRIDLSPLIQDQKLTSSRSAANGIAYDRVQQRFFVTGKLWPKLFELELLD